MRPKWFYTLKNLLDEKQEIYNKTLTDKTKQNSAVSGISFKSALNLKIKSKSSLLRNCFIQESMKIS
jgi:hypothetical protein